MPRVLLTWHAGHQGVGVEPPGRLAVWANARWKLLPGVESLRGIEHRLAIAAVFAEKQLMDIAAGNGWRSVAITLALRRIIKRDEYTLMWIAQQLIQRPPQRALEVLTL